MDRTTLIASTRARLDALRQSALHRARRVASGRELARTIAYEADALLHGLWRAIAPHAMQCTDIVAVGGYGRGELAPFSDIDIWFVFHESPSQKAKEELEAFLRALWDLHIKLGHRVGTASEIAKSFSSDHHAATAALEARLVAGSGAGFAALQRALHRWIARHQKEFVRAKLAERTKARASEGASAFAMEPDLKTGPGGLRDVQTIWWIARAWRLSGPFDDDWLLAREFDELREAESFLWRVRVILHALRGRAQDRLDFEAQAQIAELLRYEPSARPAVEVFMRDLFRRTGRIERIYDLLSEDIRLRIEPRRTRSRAMGDGFVRRGDRLGLQHPFVFRERPERLVLAFAHAHASGLSLEPDALRRIREDVHLIDDAVRASKTVKNAMRAILRTPKSLAQTLRAMHRTGVLGRVIPEFRAAVGLGQFNRYHAYTVDEHTLRAIEEAERFFDAERAPRIPLLDDAVVLVHRPDVLFFALLFHDIAKGMPGDHAHVGAEMAYARARKLGMNEDSAQLASWLVAHHLEMSRIAQRADIADAAIVRRFAELVGDPGRLAYLYLLTIADMRAVAPGVWSDWKGALLGELYAATKAELAPEAAPADRVQARRRAVLEANALPPQQAEHWLAQLPEDALVRTPPRRLTPALVLLAAGKTPAVRAGSDPEYGEQFVIVLAHDRPGLFAQLADAIARGRVMIVSAQAERLPDGRVIDWFVVHGKGGKALDAHELAAIEQRVARVLSGTWQGRKRRLKPDLLMRRIQPQVRRAPAASSRHFAVEVVAADRQGLLADLARAVHAAGWNIRSAQVATYGERAVDVFLLDPPPKTDPEAAWPALQTQLLQAARLPEDEA